MAMNAPTCSTYFLKLRKLNEYGPRRVYMAPDAFFLGSLGFRSYYKKSTNDSNRVAVGLYLTHVSGNPAPVKIKGRISMIDMSPSKHPTVVLLEDVKDNYEDWARGIEFSFKANDSKFYHYSIDKKHYTFRIDVEYCM